MLMKPSWLCECLFDDVHVGLCVCVSAVQCEVCTQRPAACDCQSYDSFRNSWSSSTATIPSLPFSFPQLFPSFNSSISVQNQQCLLQLALFPWIYSLPAPDQTPYFHSWLSPKHLYIPYFSLFLIPIDLWALLVPAAQQSWVVRKKRHVRGVTQWLQSSDYAKYTKYWHLPRCLHTLHLVLQMNFSEDCISKRSLTHTHCKNHLWQSRWIQGFSKSTSVCW